MYVPAAEFAFIGGSSTLSIEIPEDLGLDYVEVLETLKFETPFGTSPQFKLLAVKSREGIRRVLACRMHGWRRGIKRGDASRQIFWVFKQAGVKRIIAEGGVGAVNHLLNPRDLVIPHDYMDFSMRKDVGLEDRHLLIMRDALCPEMRDKIFSIAQQNWRKGKVFERGIYCNTDGRHFESPAEVNYYKIAGADIIGQSICPEVYLAREIGACYAGIYLVVNYAEGVVTPWQHEELKDIFYAESAAIGKIIFEFLKQLPPVPGCQCAELRKETLLKPVY
ncbi:5'-methylthioadenosine phosphorylase [Thermosyntropha lipolytica DSM 11003]|uniref:5'-methylthioadenosine phosphorylase n=1 Tax=Thermosyntropha lipolytica DSM 11003 TaxID=1123382 RepID=A0A1M5LA89_9FIRM|nr:MTAP family purine nucleoside phosphorylase [Thermosyntropha lipolytica]SHG61941.1 5'-methylthioadenosine phosphorylase [Thermosyntropha lipolytica DSM 11003]